MSLTVTVTGLKADALGFVCEAIAQKDTSRGMHRVSIQREGTKTLAIATDGKRMHYAEVSCDKDYAEIPLGEYTILVKKLSGAIGKHMVILKKDESGYKFPNWQRVIPTSKPSKTVKFSIGTRKEHAFSIQVALLVRAMHEGDAINLDYLRPLDALGCCDVDIRGEHEPIVFTSGSTTAIIMPIRTDLED